MIRVILKKLTPIRDKKTRLNLLREAFLMLSMFFLPFGYDALFKMAMEITGSYWIADIIFYGISGFFALLFIYYTRLLNKQK